MAINKQLGENRRIEQQQEKDRERQLKLKYENDNRVEDERQRKMAHEKHMRIKEMREALDDQVNLRMQSKRNESALTALEISLNKGLIDRVQGDPANQRNVGGSRLPPVRRDARRSKVGRS